MHCARSLISFKNIPDKTDYIAHTLQYIYIYIYIYIYDQHENGCLKKSGDIYYWNQQ